MSKYKFRFRTVMLFPLLLLSVISFSQENKDTVAHIYKYPVKEWYIYKFKDELPGYKEPDVSIYSIENDVFALMEGKVVKIFNVDEVDNVLIKKGDTCVVYGNMDSIYKKVGDIVYKGELIGKIKKDVAYEQYQLIFDIIIGKKSMLYPEYINFLKQHR